jgi:hypothetical protein
LLFSFLFCLLWVALVLVWLTRAFFHSNVRLEIKRVLPSLVTAGIPFQYELKLSNLSSQDACDLVVSDELQAIYPDADTFLSTQAPPGVGNNWFDRRVGYPKWLWLVRRLRGGAVERLRPSVIQARTTQEITVDFVPERRGLLRFSTVRVFRPEPLGLFLSSRVQPLEGTVVVLPPRYKVPHWKLSGKTMYQPGGETSASSVGESGEFISLRDYRPGDSPRQIHWKSWAKLGEPVIKETQPEYFVRHALVLDTFVDEEFDACFEEAVAVAASFLQTVETAESLLDLVFVGNRPYRFTAGRGVGHTEELLKIVATAQRCVEHSFLSLSCAVVQMAHELSGAILVFCQWDQARRDLVERLRESGVAVKVLVVCDNATTCETVRGEQGIALPLGKIQEALLGV